MPLKFQPRVGDVLRCHFDGMIEPEMVKDRDVVVIASHKTNRKLVTVVPLSTTQPHKPQAYHHPLQKDLRPDGTGMKQVWAKCDMVYTLTIERLSEYYTRSRRGSRQSVQVRLSSDEIRSIKKCVAIGVQLADNKGVPLWDFESGSASALTQLGKHRDDK